ncbi:hypothetical protein BD408DRAFT_4809 [Parasitella parasitica]|nr:hypothetical protein BD408DRAFT_4809 [Parasitella parasitica]
MNADLDRIYANEKDGACAFRIHRSVYHLISPALISIKSFSNLRIVQIDIFDSANKLQNRLNVAGNPDIRPHNANTAVYDTRCQSLFGFVQIHGRNQCRTDEIGVLIIGGEDEFNIQPCNRDIVLRLKDNVEGDGFNELMNCINIMILYMVVC